MKLILTFGLLMAVAVVHGQETPAPETYVAQIRRHSTAEGNTLRAIGGVVVSYRHVLTTSAPLTGIPVDELRVYFSSTQANTATDIRTVLAVHVNPNNALAMVVANFPQGTNTAQPIELGGLPAVGASCRAYFFQDNFGPLRSAVMTLRQTPCADNSPWCAAIVQPGVCRGYLGAPVICTEDNRIAGIVTTEHVCEDPGTVLIPVANIINIASNSDWINEVTRDEPYTGSASAKAFSVVAVVVGIILSKVL